MSDETTVAIRMQDLSPEYAEIMVLGKVLAMSGYFADVRDQAQAVTKILYGRELGFSPIVSMGGIHVIEGKPALSSNLMATLIKRSGKYDYRVTKWDANECVIMFREKVGGKWEEVGPASFSIEDAKTAGVMFKSKNGYPTSWSKFPKAMLFARALSQGLRTYCPDVSAAPIYNPEEMGAEVNGEGEITQLPKSVIQVERTTEPTPITKNEVVTTAVEPATVAYIDKNQAVNFERSFKDALHEEYKKSAKTISHEWLKSKGIIDVDGKPTAKAIRVDQFENIRDEGVRYASRYSADKVAETVSREPSSGEDGSVFASTQQKGDPQGSRENQLTELIGKLESKSTQLIKKMESASSLRELKAIGDEFAAGGYPELERDLARSIYQIRSRQLKEEIPI